MPASTSPSPSSLLHPAIQSARYFLSTLQTAASFSCGFRRYRRIAAVALGTSLLGCPNSRGLASAFVLPTGTFLRSYRRPLVLPETTPVFTRRHNFMATGETSPLAGLCGTAEANADDTSHVVGSASTKHLPATPARVTAASSARIVTPPEEAPLPNKSPRMCRAGKRKLEDPETPLLAPKHRGRPRGTKTKVASDTSSSVTKKNRSKGKSSESPSWKAPPDWQEVYELVCELRQDRTSPCDHAGAEALVDATGPPHVRRFQALVALMLSSQTKDAVVGAAVQRLKDDEVLTVQAVLDMDRSTLADGYLKSVGFRNNKARYLQETAAILLRDYGGDIPPTATLMMELPGVGPKMAYITENVAWNKQSGIGVDTHMHRLLPLLAWVRRNSKSPEQTRVDLQSWLPFEYWKDVNLLWVGFGQEIQQEKQKILTKALGCSQPAVALRLLKRCGMDVRKEATRYGLDDSVANVLYPAKED